MADNEHISQIRFLNGFKTHENCMKNGVSFFFCEVEGNSTKETEQGFIDGRQRVELES